MTTTSLETLCLQVEQESAAATESTVRMEDIRQRLKLYPLFTDAEHAFIATARDFAPKAARALRLAEAALRQIVGKPNHTNEPLVGSQAIASDALATILAQFEQPKENA